MCCLGGLSGVVKVCTFRTTACEAIGGLRLEALSGSSSCRRRSNRGKIGQLVEALFKESEIWTITVNVVAGQSSIPCFVQNRLPLASGISRIYGKAVESKHSIGVAIN